MVSSYTANLAAFLTIESLSTPISNVEELANADGAIPYGAKRGGSTFGFFKEVRPERSVSLIRPQPDITVSFIHRLCLTSFSVGKSNLSEDV